MAFTDIWKTHRIIFEQPQVTYTNQYLLVAETLENNPLICSSLPLNNSEMNSLECKSFSVSNN